MTAERLGTYTRVTKPSIHPDLFREAPELVCVPIAVSNIDTRVAKFTAPAQTPPSDRNKRGPNIPHLLNALLIFCESLPLFQNF